MSRPLAARRAARPPSPLSKPPAAAAPAPEIADRPQLAQPFRGLVVTLGEQRTHAYEEDLRDHPIRVALGEATTTSSSTETAIDGPAFLPQLIVGNHATPAYSDLKHKQLDLACELWRVRKHLRALESTHKAEEAARAAQQSAVEQSAANKADRCWSLVGPVEPLTTLPPECEADAVLRDLAATAALSALKATATDKHAGSLEPLVWPPASRRAADEEALWWECGAPRITQACAREDEHSETQSSFSFSDVADGAAWRCWLLVVRHAGTGRTVAVTTALRKPLPPQAPGVQRLAFVALGRVATQAMQPQLEQRLSERVLTALTLWRPEKPPPPQPRRELVAMCEALAFPPEYATRVRPLQPSCQPLLSQACDAIVEIAQSAKAPDGGIVRARVAAALERVREALRRAAALRPSDANLWRHRLSMHLAAEIIGRPELSNPTLVAKLMPPSPESGLRIAALRSAALDVIEGFGSADDRRRKPAVIAAVEAFASPRSAGKTGGVDWRPGAARLRAAALEVIGFFGGEGRRAKPAEILAVEAFEEARKGGQPVEVAVVHAAEAAEMAEEDGNGATAAVDVSDKPAAAPPPPEPVAVDETAMAAGAGLRTLIRLHVHPNCGGAVRKALGEVIDYLIHLTPIEKLDGTVTTTVDWNGDGVVSKADTVAPLHDETLVEAVEGHLADVDACLEPLTGGASLGAHADVISCVHELSHAPTRLRPLPMPTREEVKGPGRLARRRKKGGSKEEKPPQAAGGAFVAGYAGGRGISYACNLEVLALCLREGYVEKRVGNACYARTLYALLEGSCMLMPTFDADEAALEPPFLRRLLAESAWSCVVQAKVRDGARLGHDVKLDEVERKLSLLGPAALDALRKDLATAIGVGLKAKQEKKVLAPAVISDLEQQLEEARLALIQGTLERAKTSAALLRKA